MKIWQDKGRGLNVEMREAALPLTAAQHLPQLTAGNRGKRK